MKTMRRLRMWADSYRSAGSFSAVRGALAHVADRGAQRRYPLTVVRRTGAGPGCDALPSCGFYVFYASVSA